MRKCKEKWHLFSENYTQWPLTKRNKENLKFSLHSTVGNKKLRKISLVLLCVCECVCGRVYLGTDRLRDSQQQIKSCCQESLKSWEIRWQHLQKTTDDFIQIDTWMLLWNQKSKKTTKELFLSYIYGKVLHMDRFEKTAWYWGTESEMMNW